LMIDKQALKCCMYFICTSHRKNCEEIMEETLIGDYHVMISFGID
jgi:hypothetical protein